MEMTLLMCYQTITLRDVARRDPVQWSGWGGRGPFQAQKTLLDYTLNPSLKKDYFSMEWCVVLPMGEMAVAPPIGKVDNQTDQQPEKEP